MLMVSGNKQAAHHSIVPAAKGSILRAVPYLRCRSCIDAYDDPVLFSPLLCFQVQHTGQQIIFAGGGDASNICWSINISSSFAPFALSAFHIALRESILVPTF